MPDEVIVVPEPRPQATGTLALLERALELKLTAADLGAWMDLHERAEAKRAAALFAQALSAAQAEMPCIVKDATNSHTKSKYARLETITHDIKPVYTKHGLSLSFEPEPCPTEGFIRVRADLRHDAGHLQTYRVDMPKDGKGSQGNANAMNPLQASGSTFSYARRYLVCMIFDLVVAGEDLDGNDVQFIGPGQIQELNDGLEASGVKLAAFLQWLALESLDQMPVREFANAVGYLQRKARQTGGGK